MHRDIKPDNFLVNDEGDVKLIDFALAQRIRTGLSKLFGGRTKVQGTRSYMAPEQIRGKALDARADIYSFGCMLYELVSGRLPFTGVSPEDLLRKHLHAPVPVLAGANKNITPDFSDLVGMMMAKDADQRPAIAWMSSYAIFARSASFGPLPKPPPEQGEECPPETVTHDVPRHRRPFGGDAVNVAVARGQSANKPALCNSPWKRQHPVSPSNNRSSNWKTVCSSCCRPPARIPDVGRGNPQAAA